MTVDMILALGLLALSFGVFSALIRLKSLEADIDWLKNRFEQLRRFR